MRFLVACFVLLAACLLYAYVNHPEWFGYSQISSNSSVSSISNTLGLTTPPPQPKVWVAPDPSTVYPTTWTTRDGKIYEQVKVLDVKADAVTIMFTDGVETINLSKLPDNLQRLMNYDPDLASPAAAQRASQETLDDKTFQAEQVTDSGALVPRAILRIREARTIAKLKSEISAYQQYADETKANRDATAVLHGQEPNPSFMNRYERRLKALQTELDGIQKMYDDLPPDSTPAPEPPISTPTPAP